MRFRLFDEPTNFFSLNDYGTVLDVVRWLAPARVLEFGPGSSTLALIEGGAKHIDACEDDPEWRALYVERLEKKYPGRVAIRFYRWHDPLSIPALDAQRYDFALIDGPYRTARRPAVLSYALARCDVVLMPTEDSDDGAFLRPLIAGMVATTPGRRVEFIESGPLAGGFALIT